MKKIAYLLHNFPGITDTFIKREIRSLQAADTDVSVISVWKPNKTQTTAENLAVWSKDTEFVLPLSVLSIGRGICASFIRSPLRFLAAFRLAIETSRPGLRGVTYQLFYFAEAALTAEIVHRKKINHLHNHIGDQSGTVTMLAAKIANIEYSITFHGWPVFFDAKYSRIKEKVEGAKFIRAISYFCRSQLMMFAETDDPAPFKVVHCGLSIAKYRYKVPKEKVRTIFCAARLSPEKGLVFLIHALKNLADKGYDLELRLAGNGPSFEQLKDLVDRLGIEEKVKFLGFLDENEIIEELQESDLFVLPSYVEGIPVCVMEAMACGVPVVVTNIAGTSELVEDGLSGILVRPSDSQALVNAIVRMIKDYPFRVRAAALGREKVVEEFDVDKESAKLNKCLLENQF